MRRVEAGGVAPVVLADLVARSRQGGEQFQPSSQALARSLKKQFQAMDIPSWQRQGPLLFTPQGRLVFVPGLGLDAAFQAPAGATQLSLEWIADTEAAAGKGPGPG